MANNKNQDELSEIDCMTLVTRTPLIKWMIVLVSTVITSAATTIGSVETLKHSNAINNPSVYYSSETIQEYGKRIEKNADKIDSIEKLLIEIKTNQIIMIREIGNLRRYHEKNQ